MRLGACKRLRDDLDIKHRIEAAFALPKQLFTSEAIAWASADAKWKEQLLKAALLIDE